MLSKMVGLMFGALISFNSWSMCEYMHNPPALCVKIQSFTTQKTDIKKYPCIIVVEKGFQARPGNTYRYNNHLELVAFPKMGDYKSVKNLKFYLEKKECSQFDFDKSAPLILEYSCYDSRAEIPSLSLVHVGPSPQNIFDPWKNKARDIKCTK